MHTSTRGKQGFILTVVMILTLVPLGQSGLTVRAAPPAARAALPMLLTTVPNVGTTPTGIAVDEVHNYIYVACYGSSQVARINGENWSVVKSAPSGVVYQPKGLAVDPDSQRVYVCNHALHLSVVSGTSLTLLQAVYTGAGQTDVAVNTSLGYAFATHYDPPSVVYAVNTGTYGVSTVSNLANGAKKIALSPDGKLAYVACQTTSSIDVVDTASQVLIARYFGHFSTPAGIAVNPSNGYLYVGNSGNGTVAVVDDRNDLKATIPLVYGSGTVRGVAYNPTTNHIFVVHDGNPNAQVYVYDGTSYASIGSPIAIGATQDAIFIAVDETRNRVYVTNQTSNSVSVIQDTATATTAPPPSSYPGGGDESAVPEPPEIPSDEAASNGCPIKLTDISVGITPQGIAVDDANHVAYVANNAAGTVARINLETNVQEATSPASLVFGPTAVAVNTTTTPARVYVANGATGYNSISILYGTSLSLAAYIQLLQKPRSILMVPDIGRAYVTNHDDAVTANYLTEIDTLSNTKLRDISLTPADKGPYAVALSPDRQIAYVSCHSSTAYGYSIVAVVDLSLGKEVGQWFTWYSQPTDIILDPVTTHDRMYVANEGNGTVVAVDHRNLLSGSLAIGGKPRGLVMIPAFRRLAVMRKDSINDASNMVLFVNTATFSMEPCPPVLTPTADRWLAFSPRYNCLYTSLTGSNSVTVIENNPGDSYEPDDSYDQAHVVLYDAPQTHSIDPLGDVDWVKFTVDAPMTITMVTTDTYPGLYTTTLSLYDTNGTTPLVTDTNPIEYFFGTSGTYYLKVNATNPNVGHSTYLYQLLVTGGPSASRIYLPLVIREE